MLFVSAAVSILLLYCVCILFTLKRAMDTFDIKKRFLHRLVVTLGEKCCTTFKSAGFIPLFIFRLCSLHLVSDFSYMGLSSE